MKRFFRWVIFYIILTASGNAFAVPVAPQFFSMSNSGTTYSFVWSEVSGATEYILNYMLASNLSVVHQWSMGNARSLTVDIPIAIKLYVAISAVDQTGIGGVSDILYFDTEQVQNLPDASEIIGTDGGVVAVTHINSPLYGASAFFPAGSLGGKSLVSISKTALPAILPDGMKESGKPIDFNSTTVNFIKPIMLTLPYNDYNNDGIIDNTGISELTAGAWYFNETLRQWEERKVVSRDVIANLITIETNHFSTYIILANEDVLPDDPDKGFLKGEYFIGSQSLGRNGCIDKAIRKNCGSPYFLTVRNTNGTHMSGLTVVVDRHVTQWLGYPAIFSADMKSASFDASAIFEKIKQSGNADFWEWKCDFVKEHTDLIDYIAVNEDDLDQPEGEKIYATIKVDPENLDRVIIDWGIDISSQLNWGETLAIMFEATYVGAPEP